MAQIAIGGFQHEANTFAPAKADFEAFARGDKWPALTRGGPLLEAVAEINIPIAGFVEEARRLGHRLSPLSWAGDPFGPGDRRRVRADHRPDPGGPEGG